MAGQIHIHILGKAICVVDHIVTAGVLVVEGNADDAAVAHCLHHIGGHFALLQVQGRHILLEVDQRLVGLEHIHMLDLQSIVQLVDLVAALIGVVVAALGAQELFTSQDEAGTVGGQHHGVGQHSHLLDGVLVGDAGGTDAVVEGVVVVAGDVVDSTIGIGDGHGALGVALQAGQDLLHISIDHGKLVGNPTLGHIGVQTALDQGITHLIIELAHALQLIGVDLDGLLAGR